MSRDGSKVSMALSTIQACVFIDNAMECFSQHSITAFKYLLDKLISSQSQFISNMKNSDEPALASLRDGILMEQTTSASLLNSIFRSTPSSKLPGVVLNPPPRAIEWLPCVTFLTDKAPIIKREKGKNIKQ